MKMKLVALNFVMFLAGMSDASTGALVPYLQPGYNIGLLFVALVYLCNFAGWILAAALNVHITARIGTSGALLLGSVLQLTGHSLQFWKPPYGLFLATYFITGMGIALMDAQPTRMQKK